MTTLEHHFVYAGRRLHRGNAVNEWHLSDRVLHLTTMPAQVVGGIYAMSADIVEKRVHIHPGTSRYTGRTVRDLDQIAAWQAADAAARAVADEVAADRRRARAAEIDEALAGVLALARHSCTRADVTVLARTASERILAAWHTR